MIQLAQDKKKYTSYQSPESRASDKWLKAVLQQKYPELDLFKKFRRHTQLILTFSWYKKI